MVPGSIEQRSGGYKYDREIVAGLRRRGWTVEVHEIEGRPAADVLAEIPDGAIAIVDGLAFGTMPDEVERERTRLRLVALVHMPLALDLGLDAEVARRLEAGERRALACASLVIATGESTMPILEDYGVGADRIVLVEPGTDRAPVVRCSSDSRVELLSVAALTRGKGHEVLVRALASMPNRNWHLTCAGSLDRDPETARRVLALVRTENLDTYVSFAGELDDDRLADCYGGAEVFVLATLRETYGMAVAEAIAHGLPVVSTTTGAIPALVGSDAGLLVAPGDAERLRDALTTIIEDAPLRRRLANGAIRARDRLRTWGEATEKMVAALDRIVR